MKAETVDAGSSPVERGVRPVAEALHAAVCQAVALLNRAPEVARCTEGREARDLLRHALVAYADAYMDEPVTERERATVAAKHQQPSRSKRLLAAGFKPRPRLPSDE